MRARPCGLEWCLAAGLACLASACSSSTGARSERPGGAADTAAVGGNPSSPQPTGGTAPPEGASSSAGGSGAAASSSPDASRAATDAATAGGPTGSADASTTVPPAPVVVDASVDPTTGECRLGERVCAPFAEAEVFGVTLYEEPKYEDDYDSGRWQRTLTLATPATATVTQSGTPGTWEFSFDVETTRPSTGQLVFAGAKPLGVLSPPSSMTAAFVGRFVDCLAPGASQPEPARLGQNVLRDGSGALLTANGFVPLTASGEAVFAQDDLPEVTLGWTELGCAGCPEAPASARVGLTLRVNGTGATTTILPGERADVRIGPDTFLFASRSTARPPQGAAAQCGSAYFSLARKDLWLSLNDAGTAPAGN